MFKQKFTPLTYILYCGKPLAPKSAESIFEIDNEAIPGRSTISGNTEFEYSLENANGIIQGAVAATIIELAKTTNKLTLERRGVF